jgi:hypothetical protein
MMKTARVLSLVTLFAIGALSITACSVPPQPNLVLKPAKYCSASTLKIQWVSAIAGTTVISSEPEIFTAFTVQTQSDTVQQPIDASKLLALSQPYLITIVMDVKPGTGSPIKKDIQILAPGQTEKLSITFPPDCSGDAPKWQFVEAPDNWDQTIKIKGVLNTSGLPITVTHGGATAPLTASQLSGSFNGVSPSGSWIATTVLKSAPTPSDPTYFACKPIPSSGTTAPGPQQPIRKDPPTLSVDVTYGC